MIKRRSDSSLLKKLEGCQSFPKLNNFLVVKILRLEHIVSTNETFCLQRVETIPLLAALVLPKTLQIAVKLRAFKVYLVFLHSPQQVRVLIRERDKTSMVARIRKDKL